MRAVAAMKDRGGKQAVMPIVDALRDDGHHVDVVAPASSIVAGDLQKEEIDFLATDSVGAVITACGYPDAYITSKDSDGGIGRDLVPVMRNEGVKTFIAEDYWGTRLHTDWAEPIFRPDFVLVNDAIGRQMVVDAWPDFLPERALITGFASLDRWAKIDTALEAEKASMLLGLEPGIPKVVFVGQGPGTGEAIREVVAVLNSIRKYCCFIPRLHPRMLAGQLCPEETPLCIDAMRSFSGGRLIADSSACSTDTLVAACAHGGVVLAMFSTAIAVDAAACRTPAISVFYPNIGERAYRDELKLGTFAPERLRTVTMARNRDQLTKALEKALDGKLDLRTAQKRHFKVDGGNARRCAAAIYSALK